MFEKVQRSAVTTNQRKPGSLSSFSQRLFDGHKTHHSFPAISYYGPGSDQIWQDFKWAGRFDTTIFGKEIHLFAKAGTKDEVIEFLYIAKNVYRNAEGLFSGDELDRFGSMDCSDLLSSVTHVPRHRTAIDHLVEQGTLEIYPNVPCQICKRALNPLFEEFHIDEQDDEKPLLKKQRFFCFHCWNNGNIGGKGEPLYLRGMTAGQIARKEAYTKGDKSIHWTVVGPRENWICHICGEEVEQNTDPTNVRGATVEHLMPLAIGGPHEYENVKLAHKGCNSSKGARRNDLKKIQQ